MLKDRLDNLLPALMRETGIDMWLVINREYAEDPVYLTLVPEPTSMALVQRARSRHAGSRLRRAAAGQNWSSISAAPGRAAVHVRT